MTKKLFGKALVASAIALFVFVAGIILFRQISAYAQTDDGIVAMSKNDGDPGKYATDVEDIDPQQIQSIKYIENYKYFILNPSHSEHDEDKNSEGTCTTIAMQIMLGYHNYYSDRRLIPRDDGYGKAFLDKNYADPADNPCFHELVSGDTYKSLGTTDEVYNKIYELTLFSDISGIGQAIPLVCEGTKKFINTYSDPEIRKNVSISSGSYAEADAIAEIDADRPVVLVFSPSAAGVNDKSFHVVVAYGYAAVDNVFGYIVHYGWDIKHHYAWVPANCFGYMATMKVNHTHSYSDAGTNVTDTYYNTWGRELKCDTCGGNTVDELYDVEEITDGDTSETRYRIVKVNYPVWNVVSLPEKIREKDIVEIGDGAFKQAPMSGITFGNITEIGESAFEGCENLTSADISDINNIGNRAFAGCVNLKSIYISKNLTNIGTEAFIGCYNASIIASSENIKFSTVSRDNILYDKNKTKIIHAGKIARDIEIPASVLSIEDYAFSKNIYLESIRFKSNTKIGTEAFAGCKNLKHIYITSKARLPRSEAAH